MHLKMSECTLGRYGAHTSFLGWGIKPPN